METPIQSRTYIAAIVLIAAGSLAVSASGATVTLMLNSSQPPPDIRLNALGERERSAGVITTTAMLKTDGPPGTFTLTAQASIGDNGGISSYGIPLTGPILTLDHRTPYEISSANFAPTGFSNLRSADGVTNVFAGQPLTGPAANYLYEIGQKPNSYAGLGIPLILGPDPTSDTAWLAPIVIATGTYNPALGLPQFAPPTSDLFTNLFATAGNSTDKISATLVTEVLDIFRTPPTWSNLQPVVGPGLGVPAIAATLDASGNFSWDPAGSQSGPKGSGVLYQWRATVLSGWGADTDVAFSVILIPEPATLLLVALASIGCVACLRRSN